MRRSSPEFDLALDFERLALLGTEWLELLVALLEFLEVGGRDGRTNAEGRRHGDLTRIGFGVGGCIHDRFGRDIGARASAHQHRGRAPKTPTLLDVLGAL